jgi:hypothetical protein
MELINSINNNFGDIKGEVELTSIIFNNNIIKPDFQRDLDLERCQKIVQNMNIFFEKNKYCKIIGTIFFAKINNNYYLIDGQHRIHAAQILYNLTDTKIYVDIHIYICDSIDKAHELFQILNFNQTIPKWMKNTERENIIKYKNVINKIYEKYGDIIVKNDSVVQIPKFNISKFFDISKKYNFFDDMLENQIYDFIENLNINTFLSLDKYKLNDTISKKLEKIKLKTKLLSPIFYLGAIRLSGWDKFFKKKMYNNINEDIIFNLFIL